MPERLTYCDLEVLELTPGASRHLDTGVDELIVLPLAGACSVTCDGEEFMLGGRQSVFSAVSDFAYLPLYAQLEIASEEIYYFEVARSGFGYQRAYGPGIDICKEVRSGDTVLLPRGYHGPSMAAPGSDLHYLNVMAGPGERTWRFRDDPAHAWIRTTWTDQEIDPRLPMTAARRHS